MVAVADMLQHVGGLVLVFELVILGLLEGGILA
jgi:hypothetical protein